MNRLELSPVPPEQPGARDSSPPDLAHLKHDMDSPTELPSRRYPSGRHAARFLLPSVELAEGTLLGRPDVAPDRRHQDAPNPAVRPLRNRPATGLSDPRLTHLRGEPREENQMIGGGKPLEGHHLGHQKHAPVRPDLGHGLQELSSRRGVRLLSDAPVACLNLVGEMPDELQVSLDQHLLLRTEPAPHLPGEPRGASQVSPKPTPADLQPLSWRWLWMRL